MRGHASKIEVGMTLSGLQVWCKRCNIEICAFTPDELAERVRQGPPDCERCHGPCGGHLN